MQPAGKKKTAIIGAGPAGLAAGHELSKRDVAVEMFEASGHVGGMARTFELFGQRVDCGPHRFFSKEKLVNDFFREVVKDDYVLVDRLTRIYFNNRFFDYPLKVSNVIRNLGIGQVAVIMGDYLLQRLRPIRNPSTFEEWVVNRFGRRLFNVFFKNYSEKLWGIPCSEIDADWAAQRIKTLSLSGAVKAALFGDKGKKHKTLVDRFAYPVHGTGTIYDNAADYITGHGNAVHTGKPVKKLLVEGTHVKGLLLDDGQEVRTDHVISTMPITLLLKGMPDVPAEVEAAASSLRFRNTILVYLEVDSTDLFADNWVYVHSGEVQHGRVTNFRNWSPALYGNKQTTILCMEYWAFDEDKLWQSGNEELAELAGKEIKQTGLLPEKVQILNSHVLRLPRCYPVYDTGYKERLQKVIDYFKPFSNLTLIGRYGSFKYNNQDHSILMGLLAARNIAEGTDIDLWAINTDIAYQEQEKVEEIFS